MDELLNKAREELKLAREMIEMSELIRKKEQLDVPYWQVAKTNEKKFEHQEEQFQKSIIELDMGVIMLIKQAADRLTEYRYLYREENKKELKVV